MYWAHELRDGSQTFFFFSKKNRCERRDGLLEEVGEAGEVGDATSKFHAEQTSEQELVQNEFRDARKMVVTESVAHFFLAKSSFLESEGGTKQVEKVVKGAYEVGGVL